MAAVKFVCTLATEELIGAEVAHQDVAAVATNDGINPESAERLSLPGPPLMTSFPSSPQMMSLPNVLRIVSFPSRPTMTSSPGDPTRMSSPVVPVIVATSPKQLGN